MYQNTTVVFNQIRDGCQCLLPICVEVNVQYFKIIYLIQLQLEQERRLIRDTSFNNSLETSVLLVCLQLSGYLCYCSCYFKNKYQS